MDRITVTSGKITEEIKRKALFVLQCKGSNLSNEVQKLIEKEAKEFEKYIGG